MNFYNTSDYWLETLSMKEIFLLLPVAPAFLTVLQRERNMHLFFDIDLSGPNWMDRLHEVRDVSDGELYVSGTINKQLFTDAVIRRCISFAQGRLKKIRLSNLHGITASGLEDLRNQPFLKSIHLERCKNIVLSDLTTLLYDDLVGMNVPPSNLPLLKVVEWKGSKCIKSDVMKFRANGVTTMKIPECFRCLEVNFDEDDKIRQDEEAYLGPPFPVSAYVEPAPSGEQKEITVPGASACENRKCCMYQELQCFDCNVSDNGISDPMNRDMLNYYWSFACTTCELNYCLHCQDYLGSAAWCQHCQEPYGCLDLDDSFECESCLVSRMGGDYGKCPNCKEDFIPGGEPQPW